MERPVTEQDSSTNSSKPQEKLCKTVAEIFDEAFPAYLNMGMSREEFWEQDPSLAKYYRKAALMREKQRIEQDNYSSWLQGYYFYQALCCASPLFHDFAKRGTKAAPYLQEPIEMYSSKKEMEEKEMTKNIEAIRAYIRAVPAKKKSS